LPVHIDRDGLTICAICAAHSHGSGSAQSRYTSFSDVFAF
jgi:hypothetical protein